MKHKLATQVASGLFAVLLVAVPVLAHHGNAAFDPGRKESR